jgi:bleomycin hydrolase
MPLNAAMTVGIGNPALNLLPQSQIPMSAPSLIQSAMPVAGVMTPAVPAAAPAAAPTAKKPASATARQNLNAAAVKSKPGSSSSAAFDGAKPAKGVSSEWVQSMIEQDKAVDGKTSRLRDVVQRVGFSQTALNRSILAQHNSDYTVDLSRGPITDQKSSGRCWIFAGLNMVRSMMIAQNANLKNLELSQNYLHFFNMLEKSNSQLEHVVDTIYKPVGSKSSFERHEAVIPGISDGGWYEYFAFLVTKYGMVPKAAMPETISSESTNVLLDELNASLAATAAEMIANAKLFKAGRKANLSQEIKRRGMTRVWSILATHLGDPPSRIEYRTNGEPKTTGGITSTPAQVKSMTPQEFAKKVAKFNPSDYVSITSYPEKKLDTVYEVPKSAIGAAKPGEPKFDLRFLNVSSERMEQLAARAIKGGQPVWFAADIGQDTDRATGIMHPRIFDRDAVYPKDAQAPTLNRKQRSYFRQITPNHAMLLTGFDRPSLKRPIVKFKVENSWNDKTGDKGIYHMYHEWFMQNVFEVVVHKKFLTAAERARYAGKAVEITEDGL